MYSWDEIAFRQVLERAAKLGYTKIAWPRSLAQVAQTEGWTYESINKAGGYKEVTLLGQTVNAYRHQGVGFAELLERVAAVDGMRRIRFTSPHPNDFDDRTLEVMAAHANIMEHVHLPVQSGADRILHTMRREHTRGEFIELVGALRRAMPAITLTTDVIVGFPGETRAEFEATLDLVREVQFESAFMFMYSQRSGTTAARDLDDDIPRDAKSARLRELIDLQESISAARNRSWEGRETVVLVEGESRKDPERLFGKNEHMKTVIVPAGTAVAGDLVRVEVEGSTSHTLFAGDRQQVIG
jgi:tRNA-2-methylthio-N6-dimethylallyladenosine synthase